MLYNVDLSLFHAIYSLQGQTPLLDWFIIFIASYLPWCMGAAVAWWAYHDFRSNKRKNIFAYIRAVLIAFMARFGVAEVVYLFWHRPRPFIMFHLPHLVTNYAYSFPSGHSLFLFGLATGVFFIHKRYGYSLYALSLLVGIGRVAAGVHYPSDILGGALLGIATGYAICALWKI